MNQESTEAVLELCLHTQHENTKRAILNRLTEQYDRNLCRAEIIEEVEDIAYWIANLKLEDAKCAETD